MCKIISVLAALLLILSSCTEGYLYDKPVNPEEDSTFVPTIINRDSISDDITMYPD